MRFLNGFKTALGALGLAVYYINDNLIHLIPEPWPAYVAGASAVLTTLGVVHKVEKVRAEKVVRDLMRGEK